MTILNELLNLDIPEPDVHQVGFLDILDKGTHENTISNVFAYFLDPSSSPHLAPLFLKSLLEIVGSKSQNKDLEFTEYEVLRELSTSENGRIDLVIHSALGQSAIIIEAKIYHSLENDLDDYWNRFAYPEHKKVGVVLSLFPLTEIKINNPNFVSVTYTEWLSKIREMDIGEYISVRNRIYFEDLERNMTNLTKATTMNERISFYLQNPKLVQAAVASQNETFDFILANLKACAGTLDLVLEHNTSRDWRHMRDVKNDAKAYYTFYPSDIMNYPNSLEVVFELYDYARPFAKQIRRLAETEFKDKGFTTRTDGESNEYHKKIVSKEYDLTFSDFESLSSKLVEVITNDFEGLRLRSIEVIKSLRGNT